MERVVLIFSGLMIRVELSFCKEVCIFVILKAFWLPSLAITSVTLKCYGPNNDSWIILELAGGRWNGKLKKILSSWVEALGSSDFNPLDYKLSSELEMIVCKTSHKNLNNASNFQTQQQQLFPWRPCVSS